LISQQASRDFDFDQAFAGRVSGYIRNFLDAGLICDALAHFTDGRNGDAKPFCDLTGRMTKGNKPNRLSFYLV
jgi:hypothetical protein